MFYLGLGGPIIEQVLTLTHVGETIVPGISFELALHVKAHRICLWVKIRYPNWNPMETWTKTPGRPLVV